MLKHVLTHFTAVGLIALASPVIAAPASIELPTETAQLKSSDYPGYKIAQQKCSICHSVDYINLQPPGRNLQQWTAEVSKMQHAYGAPISDSEVKLVAEYLAATYGNGKPGAVKGNTTAKP